MRSVGMSMPCPLDGLSELGVSFEEGDSAGQAEPGARVELRGLVQDLGRIVECDVVSVDDCGELSCGCR